MTAVILAAGLAKRLRPLTDETPKCLLDIGGGCLLGKTITALHVNGFKDYVIVTGYREEMIRQYVVDTFPDIKVTFLHNADYENNNNAFSLLMTKGYTRDGIILLDSDILFEAEIITKLLNSEHENCLALNSKVAPDEEQIKVLLDDQMRVKEISKQVPLDKSGGESIGIEKFSEDFMNMLYETLEKRVIQENRINEFYEASFQEVIETERNSIYAVDVSEYECTEMDTVEDYEKVKQLVALRDKNL